MTARTARAAGRPYVGAVLELEGARYVVIGEAGTVNRGTMPLRAVDRALGAERWGNARRGWHVQHLETGALGTVDPRDPFTVAGDYLAEQAEACALEGLEVTA